MKRYNLVLKKETENPAIDQFLGEIAEVCTKYGFSISHEDTQGSFVIEAWKEKNIKWIMEAMDRTYMIRDR